MIKINIALFNIFLSYNVYGFIDENALKEEINKLPQLRLQLFEKVSDNPLIKNLRSMTVAKKIPTYHDILDYFNDNTFFDGSFSNLERNGKEGEKKSNAHDFPGMLTLENLIKADFFVQLMAGNTLFKLKESNPIGIMDTQKKMANLLFKIGSWAYTVHTDRFQRLFESNNDGSKVSNHLNRCLEAIIAGSYGLEAVNPFFKERLDKNLINERDPALYKVTEGFKGAISNKIPHDKDTPVYIQQIINPNGSYSTGIYQIDTVLNQKPVTYMAKIEKKTQEKNLLNKIEKRLDPKELVFAEYIGHASFEGKDVLLFKKAEGVMLARFLKQSIEIDNNDFLATHFFQIGLLMGKLHNSNKCEIENDGTFILIKGFSHNDAHHGNFFYSWYKKKLTAIDYGKARFTYINDDISIFFSHIASCLNINLYEEYLENNAGVDDTRKNLYINNIKKIVDASRDGYLSAYETPQWRDIASKEVRKCFFNTLGDFGGRYDYSYTKWTMELRNYLYNYTQSN